MEVLNRQILHGFISKVCYQAVVRNMHICNRLVVNIELWKGKGGIGLC